MAAVQSLHCSKALPGQGTGGLERGLADGDDIADDDQRGWAQAGFDDGCRQLAERAVDATLFGGRGAVDDGCGGAGRQAVEDQFAADDVQCTRPM